MWILSKKGLIQIQTYLLRMDNADNIKKTG